MSYDFGELCILSGSRSALQHLSGWSSANDETSVSILLKLRKTSQTHDVHLQWLPSHVNIIGNEITEIDWPKRIVRMKRLLAFRSLIKNCTLMQDVN
ncbi:hypothetical protein TNCV_746821 [Trichonephila clavipes]|nr:hypothetical protein TNCV_746821 [Trichonephila clavipes]